jgi:hypothetical protein
VSFNSKAFDKASQPRKENPFQDKTQSLQYQESFEDTQEIIGICISEDSQCNGQKKMDNKTNNDLQNITQKTKDQATKTISRVLNFIYHIMYILYSYGI